jgi:hypothetical protein
VEGICKVVGKEVEKGRGYHNGRYGMCMFMLLERKGKMKNIPYNRYS